MNKVSDYFDISDFPFKELFGDVEAVWDVLGRIGPFLEAWGRFDILGDVSPHAWLQGSRIAVGKGTVVEPGALIKGTVLIGENCEIRQGAYIRGNAIIGNNCVVGHTTEVKNAVFLNGAKAGHFAYIGDSILGNGVNLGAGTKLANFKVDTGDRCVCVALKDHRCQTGLRKMGAVLGDGCELGCNCVTMPGAIVGRNTLVYPNATLRGFTPHDSVVKLRQDQDIAPRVL
jgi:NDP-sugar pyrophosphorylase family protein